MTLTGFAVCARTFARINLYAPDRTRGSYGVLTANKNELPARAFEGASALVLVLWSWALVAERAFKTGGGAGWALAPPPVRCCQLAKRTGAGVSWLRALWRRRKLAAQAAYILVPASRASTSRGILPRYLGLCWCNLWGSIWTNLDLFV